MCSIFSFNILVTESSAEVIHKSKTGARALEILILAWAELLYSYDTNYGFYTDRPVLLGYFVCGSPAPV